VVAVWARKYVSEPDGDVAAAGARESGVVVRTGTSKYRTDIIAGRHRLVADEPVSAGGTDAGPTPYDYLAAALGSCTSMTLRMYADRKGWPLEETVVRLGHRKIHAQDCESCETQTGLIDRFDRDIELAGPLDAAQRERLLQIADRCPVHRTLHGEVQVKTTLKDA
jgi:putative redox protein